MDSKQFRIYGKELVDYICDYLDTVQKRKVVAQVEAGYLEPLLPKEAPQKGEDWSVILKDVEDKIMQGITHWEHPQFHAYFPNGNSFPSILADMISDMFGCVGFSWAASPAMTELETIVLDWLGKALSLPPDFLFFTPESRGGGVIQSSASECTLVCMLAARAQALTYLKKINGNPNIIESEFLPKLVAYCSLDAHSSVEKDAMISLVRLRTIKPDVNGSLRGESLREAIDKDLHEGLHPFFVLGTLGTTGSCSFDNLVEMADVVRDLPACWFHVDAAYAGGAFICPENRYLMDGVDNAHSFNTNCNKLLNICYDCSCLWVKDRFKLTEALTVNPLYLQHEKSKVAIDYRHWGIPLSRRFRSLKLWFTLRNFGIEGLREYVRNHCRLAKYFEKLVLNDPRFEVCNEVKLGLVCFRLKGSDKLNQELLASINSEGDAHMIPSMFNEEYVIRFCINHINAKHEHIDKSWSIIQEHATKLLTHGSTAPRRLTRIHSFTRSVSKEFYERANSRGSLYDGATPIVVVEDDIEDSNNMNGSEDVFDDENYI